jgi:hypothetical protein
VKRNTKKVGIVSELKLIAALAEADYRVLIPYGDTARYDVVIENNRGGFARVQIKTGRLRNGSIQFNAYSSHTHRGGAATRPYFGEVDFFGVYCPQISRCYLVPASEVRTCGTLRVETPRNGQLARVRWASVFELGGPCGGVVGAEAGNVVPIGA